MNSAICRYGDLRYQKKLRTVPTGVFTPPLLVPASQIADEAGYWLPVLVATRHAGVLACCIDFCLHFCSSFCFWRDFAAHITYFISFSPCSLIFTPFHMFSFNFSRSSEIRNRIHCLLVPGSSVKYNRFKILVARLAKINKRQIDDWKNFTAVNLGRWMTLKIIQGSLLW